MENAIEFIMVLFRHVIAFLLFVTACSTDDLSGPTTTDKAEHGFLKLTNEEDLKDLSELDQMSEMSRSEFQAACKKTPGKTQAKRILCHMENEGIYGNFIGQDNKSIAYSYFPSSLKQPKTELAALVLVSGRTESMLKYAEMIYDFQVLNPNLGYSIFIMDLRGQGFSERLLPLLDLKGQELYMSDNYQKGHIDNFDYYVNDLDTFVREVVKPKDFKSAFILGHSLGGGVLTRYLQTHDSAKDFTSAVLSSPMHGIQALEGASGTVSEAYLLSLDDDSFVSINPLATDTYQYKSYKELLASDEIDLTNSESRHEFTQWPRRTTPFSQISLGGQTAGWVLRSYEASKKMLTDASKIETPLLLLQAGAEKIVANNRQIEFCAKMGSLCVLNKYRGAEHEIMQESDVTREQYMSRITTFFSSHSGDKQDLPSIAVEQE